MGWEILSAARNGDRVKIQKCLENGEDLNSKDPVYYFLISELSLLVQEGSTPLHLVAIKGFEDILYFLLEQHADINSLDEVL